MASSESQLQRKSAENNPQTQSFLSGANKSDSNQSMQRSPAQHPHHAADYSTLRDIHTLDPINPHTAEKKFPYVASVRPKYFGFPLEPLTRDQLAEEQLPQTIDPSRIFDLTGPGPVTGPKARASEGSSSRQIQPEIRDSVDEAEDSRSRNPDSLKQPGEQRQPRGSIEQSAERTKISEENESEFVRPTLQENKLRENSSTAVAKGLVVPPKKVHDAGKLAGPGRPRAAPRVPPSISKSDNIATDIASVRQGGTISQLHQSNLTSQSVHPSPRSVVATKSPIPTTTAVPSGTTWPTDRVSVLASIAVKAILSDPINHQVDLSQAEVIRFLQQRLTYDQLCEQLYAKGLVFSKGEFAKTLLAAVSDPKSATSSSPTVEASTRKRLRSPDEAESSKKRKLTGSAGDAPAIPAMQLSTTEPVLGNLPRPLEAVSNASQDRTAISKQQIVSPIQVQTILAATEQQNSWQSRPMDKPQPTRSLLPPSRLIEEQTAHATNFDDIVDLTQLNESDDGDVPANDSSTTATQIPRAETAVMTEQESLPPLSQPTQIPYPSAIHQIPRPDTLVPRPKPTQDKLRSTTFAKPLDSGKAARKSFYNPATIARDFLIARGEHPAERPLNFHLKPLIDNFTQLSYRADLSTFPWDLVDPVENETNDVSSGTNMMRLPELPSSSHSRSESRKDLAIQEPAAEPTAAYKLQHGTEPIQSRLQDNQQTRDPLSRERILLQHEPLGKNEVARAAGHDTVRPPLLEFAAGATATGSSKAGGVSDGTALSPNPQPQPSHEHSSTPTSLATVSAKSDTTGNAVVALPAVEMPPVASSTPVKVAKETQNSGKANNPSTPGRSTQKMTTPSSTGAHHGQPPKSATAASSTNASQSYRDSSAGAAPIIKRRGRPPGSKNSPLARKTGRPAKAKAALNTVMPADGIGVVIPPSPQGQVHTTVSYAEEPPQLDKKPKRSKARPVYPENTPDVDAYIPFKCRWLGCKAELHNLETLRKHILKVHRDKCYDDSVKAFSCYWDNCEQFDSFQTQVAWEAHIKENHLDPMALELGDGPTTHPAAPDFQYLRNQHGQQVTPIVQTQGRPDPLPLYAGRGPTRAYHLAHGNNTVDEKLRAERESLRYHAVCAAQARNGGLVLNRTAEWRSDSEDSGAAAGTDSSGEDDNDERMNGMLE